VSAEGESVGGLSYGQGEQGGRRVRTPSQKSLERVAQAAKIERISVEEYKLAFGAQQRALPRTPPRLY
jgi:hypothetical protein